MAHTLKNLVFAASITVFGLSNSAHACQLQNLPAISVLNRTQDADELFALATGHYERQEWQLAVEKFQLFIQSSPNHPQLASAWFFTGEALLQTGSLSQARSAYQHFQILNSRKDLSEKTSFRLAEISARTNDAQAVRFLEDFLQRYPQSTWREFALYYLGHKRLSRNEPQLARRVLEAALTEFPDSLMRQENLLGVGIACRSMGELDPARGYFIQLESEASGALRYGAMLQLAGIYVLQEEFEQARVLVEELTSVSDLPEALSGEAWLLAGTCNADLKNDDAAIECFQYALESANDVDLSAVATWQMATALRRQTKLTEANEQFQQLTKTWPQHRLAVHAATALVESTFQLKNWSDTIQHANAALEFKLPLENASKVQELKGRAQYELEEYAECEKTFEALLGSTPNSRPLTRGIWLYFAGSSQIGLNEFSAAVETLEQIKLNSLDPEMAETCRMSLATAYLGAGQFAPAASTYRAVANKSGNPELKIRARNEMMVALAREADLTAIELELDEWWKSEAGSARCNALTRRIAQQAVAANKTVMAKKCFEYLSATPGASPDSRAESLSAMAWMALEKGDPDTALEYFEQLTRDYGDSPLCADCWIAMASIHEQRESWETASWMYGHATEFSPKPSTRHAAMFKQAVMLRKIGTAWSITRGGNILRELDAIEDHGIPNEQLQYELAWFDQHAGQPDASLARFEKIAESPSESPVWADSAFRVAQRHMQAGEHDSASAMLAKLVVDKRTPEALIARSHFLLGQIASSSSDWKLAETEIQQAIGNSDDEDFELRAQYWLAECQFRNGKFEVAAGAFADLAILESRFDNSIIPWIWLRVGQCQAQLNDWTAVAIAVRQSSGRFPTFASNWEFDFLAGRERFAAGMFDDAIVLLGKVTSAPTARGSETAAQAQWLIGEACFHQEKYKEAIEAYYKVDSLYNSPKWRPAAIVQAGKCQEHLGNRSHAIALYSQLIKKFPDSQYAAPASQRLELLHNQSRTPAARTAVRKNPNPVQAKQAQSNRVNTDARKRQ